MTQTVRPVGLLLIITSLLLFALGPRISMAADDMWEGVFAYQKKMADYGNPEAQVKLGEMYEEGHGTEQDYDMAQQWYQKAADQGYAPAKERLTKLEARRKREAKAEEERLAKEKAEQARRQREAAEQARLERERKAQKAAERAEQERAEQAARDEAEQERLAKEQAEKEAAEQARKAEEERLAKERAKEAIKEMMSVPSAYSEEE